MYFITGGVPSGLRGPRHSAELDTLNLEGLSRSTRFKPPVPAHHELSWGLTNLQKKLNLSHSFSQPFQKPREAQIVHYNCTLTTAIRPSNPSACGPVGYKRGKERIEKEQERGEGSKYVQYLFVIAQIIWTALCWKLPFPVVLPSIIQL